MKAEGTPKKVYHAESALSVSEVVCDYRMADLGMNIVMVIHQPRYSVFTLFHEVLFLGKQGRAVFLGPAQMAMLYFTSLGFDLPQNENPADFCLDIISGVVACRRRPGFQPEVCHSTWLDKHSHLAAMTQSSSLRSLFWL